MWYRLNSLEIDSSSIEETMIQLAAAVAIVLERSFYIWDQQRHLQDQQEFVNPFDAALEQYEASPNAAAVRKARPITPRGWSYSTQLLKSLSKIAYQDLNSS